MLEAPQTASDPAQLGAKARVTGSPLILLRSLFVVGLLARVLPLFDFGGRLLREFPTEDGYLMLTIARNMALGRGMSTAAGLLPTNGTQPLFTLIQAACFYLVGGDRRGGVVLTLIVGLGLSLLSAFVLWRFALLALRMRPQLAQRAAGLAVGIWYASPIVFPHSMNCLETGLYGALLGSSVHYWYRMWLKREGQRMAFRSAVLLGGLLGLTFWSRIDAVFVIGAITLTHAGMALRDGSLVLRARLIESIVMGLVSMLVASPWLIHNYLLFGSIVPISGQSESFGVAFATNLSEVPPKLFEYANLIVPIPGTLEQLRGFMLLAILSLAAYCAVLVISYRRLHREERALFWLGTGLSVSLIAYYGLLFGAPYFMSRYFFPISIFSALFMAVILVVCFDRWAAKVPWARRLVSIGGGILLLLLIGQHVRLYRNGTKHMHFQVVEWVQMHVPETAWVAAIQTGALGFFHERTINLDGKVNPEALEMRKTGELFEYVVRRELGPERARIQYVVDWSGITSWIGREPIKSHFELLVNDPQRNLGVMRRRVGQ